MSESGQYQIPIWVSNFCGNEKNCRYADERNAESEEMLREAVSLDHTFICFKNHYRCEENFLYTDTLVVDCDNSHTDEAGQWVKPDDVVMAFPEVRFVIYTSRNHMKQKGGKAPRPKFHVIFFIHRITQASDYKKLLARIQEYFPYFDTKALDASRFFYGNPDTQIFFRDGRYNLTQFFHEEDAFASMGEEIQEGSRNASMFKWAVRSMKRYGNTKESKKCFYVQAEKCNPPLEQEELEGIWRSAARYYQKIASQPDYVPPQEYNNPGPVNWVRPIPFSEFTMMRFPIEALPNVIGAYVQAVAESTQTPVDMAGAVALSILSVCQQGKYKINGKADWAEPLNTYVLIIAPPSERKSAVMHQMIGPVNLYEVEYNKKNAGSVESNKMQKRILEKRQKALEDAIAKGKAEPDELTKIAQEIADFEEVRPLQMYVDDITTEKLVSVLSTNNGRAAIVSSEGGIFDTLSGIYTKNVNIDVMLKGYSGDPIRVDRIGRESECIMDPALSVLLMAQPSVVADVLNNTTFRGRGLTARFLYCMPTSAVGSRKFESATIPEEVYREYERLIFNLLEDEYREKPDHITLSKEAGHLLAAFAEEIEPKLLTDYAEMADWVGKLVGNTLRIAGLLCRAERYISHDFLEKADALVVEDTTMKHAILLGRYFLNHAQAAYSVLPQNAMCKKADKILQAIKERKLKEFDRREMMRICRNFKTVTEIQPVLDFLDDYGYIAANQEKPMGAGRPTLPKYAVNPWVFLE